MSDADQLAILAVFAARLVAETVELPQSVMDAINDNFWDLI